MVLSKNIDKPPKFPLFVVLFAIFLTVFSLIWLTVYSFHTMKVLQTIVTDDFKAIELRGLIMQLDEVLTMSARMGAVTGDAKWEARYNHFDPILSDAIHQTSQFVPADLAGETAKQTDEANIKLVEMERKSFELVKQGKLVEAKNLLFSREYETQKTIYANGMNKYNEILKKCSASRCGK